MNLYHASCQEVVHPDTIHSRAQVDFGRGFYTTPLIEQAKNWGKKFLKQGQAAVINYYQFDETALKKCKVLNFDSYSEDWLDFIINCRLGKDETDYDIVMGGVANDKVFNTVELFFNGLIEKKEALKRLRYEKPNYQVAFRTQEIIDQYLIFDGSERL